MYVDVYQFDKLAKFMVDNFGRKLYIKRKKTFCRPHLEIIKREAFNHPLKKYLDENKVHYIISTLTPISHAYPRGRSFDLQFFEILNTFSELEDKFEYIRDMKGDYTYIYYLEQFDENGETRLKDLQKIKEKHKNQIVYSVYPSNPDYLSFEVVSPYISDSIYWKKKKVKDTYYYFVNEQDKDKLINAVFKTFNFKPKLTRFKIENDELRIKNLVLFKYDIVTDERKPEIKPEFKNEDLMTELKNVSINYFLFENIKGTVNMKFGENRQLLYIQKFYEKESLVNYKQGFRKDLGLELRSSWEADFARILNHIGVKWEYENEFLSSKNGPSYLPDFFLENNIIVEVKGYWDRKSRKTIQHHLKSKHEFKLFTIDGDMFQTLENMYRPHIKNWESNKIKAPTVTLPVVGITRSERKKYVQDLRKGMNLYFERDPDNEFDSQAIKVLNDKNEQVGFIAADWASIYSSKLDMGMEFSVIIKDIEEKVIYVVVKRTNNSKEIIFDFLRKC